MKNFIYSLLTILILTLSSCGIKKNVVKQTTYVDTHQLDRDTTITVILPKIEKMSEVEQMQTKGGVTVTCELIPFQYSIEARIKRQITYADPSTPDYDVYEILKIPTYKITPNNIKFKIKVRNNQDRVLKLLEVPIILIVDGMQTSIPAESLVEWNNSLIVKGFEKEFWINGPKINELLNASVIYIAAHDIPISYDKAGNILSKENFEWTFSIKREEIKQNTRIAYSYEKTPIYKERCSSCSGKGYHESYSQCPKCKGTGTVKKKNGKYVKCSNCGGNGKILIKDKCKYCGGDGVVSYPKSMKPPVAKEEKWTGWKVKVNTNPPGATISVVDVKNSIYKNVGTSNLEVKWYSSSSKSFPIIVEYQNKSVKVLPFLYDGSETDNVLIDFLTGSEPIVKVGKKVE